MSLAFLTKSAKVNGSNVKILMLAKDLLTDFRQESTVSTLMNASPKHMAVILIPNVLILMEHMNANAKLAIKTTYQPV